MLQASPAKRLLITVDEGDTWQGRRLYDALLGLLQAKGLAGATASRPIAAFTGHEAIRSADVADVIDVGEPMPVRIEVADRPELIEAVLPDVYTMVEHGLVEVQDTNVVKWWSTDDRHQRSTAKKRESIMRFTGQAKELHIYLGEDDAWEGVPLFDAIVRRARELGVAGVSVYRGIEGYGSHGELHRHKALALRRSDPILITVIDSSPHVQQLLDAIETMVSDECLVTIQDVAVVKYAAAGKEATGVPLESAPASSDAKP